KGIDFLITKERDYLVLKTSKPSSAVETLKMIFGISWFARAEETKSDMKSIEGRALKMAKYIGPNETFAVRASRADKSFPHTSMEIENMIGKRIDRKVDLSKPDRTIHVEVKKDKSYVYSEKTEGAGGLPVGVSGKILCLMSGGMDSPVAAWMMMRRGCYPAFVYFSSYPLVPKSDRENVIKVLRVLRGYSSRPLTLIIVPLVKITEAVTNAVEGKYKCVIGRRIMYRVSEAMAKETKAKALLTGDSLAQVASQTLDNILSEDDVLTMPVLKPLIGMDKRDIIRIAEEIGTYEISKNIKTSCPIHTGKPATKSTPERLAEEERNVKKLDALIRKAIKEAEVVRI
ncbi:MAG: tRNA 4-thiouridine(8) synthase ThiI, partial [Candidatus Aenigmarchaeota archaeon]|nr:tRNA 4-thiouridine(8) synthase ThiI [Candidatus Aenigmarchaeota archaeon]